MGILTASDRKFIEDFENCGFGKECWTHSAHVRMAWIQITRASTFKEALERIRNGIRRFNSSVNSIGYHETVTIAFARLIQSRILLADPDQDWEVFHSQNQDLLAKTPPILTYYYSEDLLKGDISKETFVSPDRKPLPPTGIIRPAREEDAAAVLSIYVEAPYINWAKITGPTPDMVQL